uniref:Uncharacterized protein n=1 Tax=Musca domestica TaxID=7370 RepID=A0A1I8M8M6_MUSDO
MNNDDDNIPAAAAADDDESTPTTATSDITGLLQRTTTTATAAPVSIEKSLASLELQYFKAVSLYRRRNYEKCVEVCNVMLQAGHENNVQMFNTPPDQEGEEEADGEEAANPRQSNYNISAEQQPPGIVSNVYHTGGGGGATSSSSSSFSVMPTWMMEGVWQLKMRALTQRIYIDDLETNDADDAVNEEVEFERIATTARPGTSIKTAFIPRPSTSTLRSATALSRGQRTAGSDGARRSLSSSLGSRPTSGMARPGTSGLSRPGSSMGGRPASRCGTASRVRATSAAAFTIGDATAPLYQASRLNPTIYAERKVLVKALFQFLYYHEADVLKAYSLCEAVMEVHKQKRGSSASLRSLASCDEWWWQQQMGRCLLALKYPRKAETYLQQSLTNFQHPDTYILLARLYQRLDQLEQAMVLIQSAVDRHPFDVTFRIEQGRLLDAMSKVEDSMQMYRLIAKLNPINIEALACIALNYFYDNNPEMALMYYRRILSLGVHSCELYCNIGLCCLYGGQIELVLPCFQRALLTAKTSEQKADIWYNLSFVAITTGDFNLAKRCLQLCLTSDARNGAALNNLSVLAAYTGDILKAKSYLSAAKDVMPESEEVETNLKYMDEHYKL